MRAFDRWRALPGREQRLAVTSAVQVAAAGFVLHWFGIERALRLAAPPVREISNVAIADVVAAVERAGRYVPGATCLTKSLALGRMLRRRGTAAVVRIGARTDRGPFEAHAWVECAGLESGGHSSQFTAFEL